MHGPLNVKKYIRCLFLYILKKRLQHIPKAKLHYLFSLLKTILTAFYLTNKHFRGKCQGQIHLKLHFLPCSKHNVFWFQKQ
jgi:hypothetical protein